MSLNLLEKTELWINNIKLENVNLNSIAETVADVLKIDLTKVLVVDVRDAHITIDILEKDVEEGNIIGKEKEILKRISEIPGVSLFEDTYIHSNGILGLICIDSEKPETITNLVTEMTDEMKKKIGQRAIIFPTGFEVKKKLIEDTNSPYLKDLLESRGYKATIGEVIDDDMDEMVYKLSDAVDRGYGLIMTTGGVGAEDKDKTVESILRIDPEASTPYIVKFQKGTGRHVKDGVKIAVGTVGLSTLISLPGPNDEVREVSNAVIDLIERGADKHTLAYKIAEVLAKKLIQKKFHH